MNNYKFEKTTNDAVSELREEYLMSLTDPIDGMWTTFVMMSDQYMIITGDKKVGYCSINEEHKVLQFYAINDQDYIYAKMLEELDVKGAVVGTNEQHHLSLSMDNQKSVSVNALLYQCEEGIELI
ncbi:MAG: hypothetical protein P8I94_01130, partial [Emcibacteraceae bacterium]|nr:hypothetical protein [Emcibacteraceae bacterium]